MRTTTNVPTALPLDSRSPTNLRLRSGDSRLMRIAAGGEVIVTRGELTLVEPVRWLGEVGAPAMQRLRGGESHRIETAGWFTLTATRDCELAWVAPCEATPLESATFASTTFASARRIAAWLASHASSWAPALSNAWHGLAQRARRGRHVSHTA
ncbi:hypothetical protein BH11PSE9_BH11PSE9_16850 [soil metagenome]